MWPNRGFVGSVARRWRNENGNEWPKCSFRPSGGGRHEPPLVQKRTPRIGYCQFSVGRCVCICVCTRNLDIHTLARISINAANRPWVSIVIINGGDWEHGVDMRKNGLNVYRTCESGSCVTTEWGYVLWQTRPVLHRKFEKRALLCYDRIQRKYDSMFHQNRVNHGTPTLHVCTQKPLLLSRWSAVQRRFWGNVQYHNFRCHSKINYVHRKDAAHPLQDRSSIFIFIFFSVNGEKVLRKHLKEVWKFFCSRSSRPPLQPSSSNRMGLRTPYTPVILPNVTRPFSCLLRMRLVADANHLSLSTHDVRRLLLRFNFRQVMSVNVRQSSFYK